MTLRPLCIFRARGGWVWQSKRGKCTTFFSAKREAFVNGIVRGNTHAYKTHVHCADHQLSWIYHSEDRVNCNDLKMNYTNIRLLYNVISSLDLDAKKQFHERCRNATTTYRPSTLYKCMPSYPMLLCVCVDNIKGPMQTQYAWLSRVTGSAVF